MTPEPDDSASKVIQAASDVIESEQANIRIEIEFTKAARVGMLLVHWRKIMIDGGFSVEWVESASSDIFHKFFPPPIDERLLRELYGDDDDPDN